MDRDVEQEFDLLEQNKGKLIRLTVVKHSGKKVYWALLEEVYPYSALSLKLGDYNDGMFQGTVGEECPFIGAIAGIESIETQDGEVIYSNPNLRFDKKFYKPFKNREDNEYINSMRRKKFGQGHDYKMFEDLDSQAETVN